jgi:integrase
MRWGSGHIIEVERQRGPVYYAKYRAPSGRQVKKLVGPAWKTRGTPPPPGFYTKRMAEDWLVARLKDIHFGVVAGLVETRTTFREAAYEFLRFSEEDRGCKQSTLRSYRSAIETHLIPAFGHRKIEDITAQDIEKWRAALVPGDNRATLTSKTKNNLLMLLHGIFRRATKLYGLPFNPAASVDRFRVPSSGDIEVFSPEEVWSLVRAAKNEMDGTIFLTAAFTGLRRGEILALRWRDVDFEHSTIRVRASFSFGQLTTPKSGEVRAVPLAPDVATAIARLGGREWFTGDDDFVFANNRGVPINGDTLCQRYRATLERAGLRRLRFHDLRHTFGTRMISQTDIRRVQEWMGHADIQTTMRYLHYESRAGDAQLVAQAFQPSAPSPITDPPLRSSGETLQPASRLYNAASSS